MGWKFPEGATNPYYVSILSSNSGEENRRILTGSLVQFGVSEIAWSAGVGNMALNRVGSAFFLDLYDGSSGKRSRTLDKGNGSEWDEANGNLLSVATGGGRVLVKLWEPKVARQRSMLSMNSEWNMASCWSPDGQKIAT